MNRRISLLSKLVAAGGLAAALTIAVPTATGAGSTDALARPSGLKSFVRWPGEPRSLSAAGVPSFTRTPAFAWSRVRGADRYQFQLSTSRSFRADNALIWSETNKTPAASVPLALPWMTGEAASMYWRVRAIGPWGFSRWSVPRPFNMTWRTLNSRTREKNELNGVPRQLEGGPGYVRWTPVDGATGYQVWFQEADNVITTITNVADEREYYLRSDLPPSVVHWRVRAERRLLPVCPEKTTETGSTTAEGTPDTKQARNVCVSGLPKNSLPAVSHGPWSPIFTSQNSENPLDGGQPLAAKHPACERAPRHGYKREAPCRLMPVIRAAGDPGPFRLWRTYFFTDRDCVNRVFVGYPVSSPAYAPRSSGVATLSAGTHAMRDGFIVEPAELGGSTETVSGVIDLGVGPGKRAKVDLWDTSWPSGLYYAVAVPVAVKPGPVYRDLLLPEDVCAEGQAVTFGKFSEPAELRLDGAPSATGLSPGGRTFSAVDRRTPSRTQPRFYGPPLVTWKPADAAVSYEVQWSKSKARWQARGSITTAATSALLPVGPGKWFYRVRGINDSLPGNQMMSWSRVTALVVTPPCFGAQCA